MAGTSIFIDTNFFLHYRFPDESDWPAVVQAPEVELVVTPVVVDELNKHKDVGRTPRIRRRAAEVLARLHALFAADSQVALRPGVTLRFEDREPTIAFADHGLSHYAQDDRLVASMLSLRFERPEVRVLLATADTGLNLRMKARRHGIATIAPSDDQKLDDEPDPVERENAELRRERDELRRRMPALKLGFKEGAGHASITLPRPFTACNEWIAPRLAAVRREHPYMEDSSAVVAGAYGFSPAAAALTRLGEPSAEAIRHYNIELDRFYKQYEFYLAQCVDYANLRARTFHLDLELRNEDTAPADDVDVFLSFPAGLRVFDDAGLPEHPAAPKPPDRPRKGYYLPPLTTRHSMPDLSLYLPDPPTPLQVRRVDGGHEVRFRAGTLKQHLTVPIERLYVVFDSFEVASSFQVEYRINAANLAQEKRARLHVVVARVAQGEADG